MTEKGVRLGKAVLARRQALGRGRADVQMLSRQGGEKGISQEALRSIERGDRETIHSSTARGLERGLDWPAGYVDRIMAGEAEDLTEPPLPPPPAMEDRRSSALDGLLDQLATELAARERQITDLEAMTVILRYLSDDQFRTVARAVTQDERFQAAT